MAVLLATVLGLLVYPAPVFGFSGYIGCFMNSWDRLLPNEKYITPMTNEACEEVCVADGSRYFGTEYSVECFCGNSTDKHPRKPESDCHYKCSGNSSQICGGAWRISVYEIDVPNVTCDADYNTGTSSPWTVTVSCNVSGIYSNLSRYNCKLVQTSPSTQSLGSVYMSLTSSNLKYRTVKCTFIVPFPDVTGDHSYTMAVIPGKKAVPVTFGGQRSRKLKSPSASPSHNCPPYVEESQNVNCTCTAPDLGQPPGIVRWKTTMTSQLLLWNINLNQNRTQYECEIAWRGQSLQSVNYTLQVSRMTSSKSYADTVPVFGVTMAGLLFIIIVIIIVIVIWLWRRKWVLPCTERKYRVNDLNQPSSNYESLRISDMGLGSVYSSLSYPRRAASDSDTTTRQVHTPTVFTYLTHCYTDDEESTSRSQPNNNTEVYTNAAMIESSTDE